MEKTSTPDILAEFEAERRRAHDKHKGKPGGSMEMKAWDNPDWLPVVVEEIGEVARVLCDHRHGLIDDDNVVPMLRSELVQVGAMVAAWADKAAFRPDHFDVALQVRDRWSPVDEIDEIRLDRLDENLYDDPSDSSLGWEDRHHFDRRWLEGLIHDLSDLAVPSHTRLGAFAQTLATIVVWISAIDGSCLTADHGAAVAYTAAKEQQFARNAARDN